MPNPDSAGGILTIDIKAVTDNWTLLKGKLKQGAECAAVVKADAYGLGVAQVAPALSKAGCKSFFVATLDEGIELRGLLPKAKIYVFNGPYAVTEGEFLHHDLIPVLNEPAQIALWATRGLGKPCALHIDTGMGRLGLTGAEFEAFLTEASKLNVTLLMSHLACSEDPEHPKNQSQLSIFTRATHAMPKAKASLSNSSGILLGEDWHFDMARPGAALYGVNPRPGEPNLMAQPVHLQGRVIQVRKMHSNETVGYGATYTLPFDKRIATVGVGYADGFPRTASNAAIGYVGDAPTPLVGRVSMDLLTFDVTAVPEDQMQPGALIDLIGPNNPVDILADRAGTIGYEVLTSLGARYFRQYV